MRGEIEQVRKFEISIEMSAYFVRFFGGEPFCSGLIRRFGHVRVSVSPGSLISAFLSIFPLVVHPIVWSFWGESSSEFVFAV